MRNYQPWFIRAFQFPGDNGNILTMANAHFRNWFTAATIPRILWGELFLNVLNKNPNAGVSVRLQDSSTICRKSYTTLGILFGVSCKFQFYQFFGICKTDYNCLQEILKFSCSKDFKKTSRNVWCEVFQVKRSKFQACNFIQAEFTSTVSVGIFWNFEYKYSVRVPE